MIYLQICPAQKDEQILRKRLQTRTRGSVNLLWDFVFFYVRSYTPKRPPTWLPKHELIKDSNGHDNVDRSKHTRLQHYTKKYKKLRTDKSGCNSILRRGAHQIVIQHQMISPKNIRRSISIQSKQVVFIYIHALPTTIKEKAAMNLKHSLML